MAEKKHSVLTSASLIVMVMLASKLLGFVRQVVIAAAFGSGAETDLYFVSSDFMISLSGALLSALSTALVARYIEISVKDSRKAAGKVASQMLSLFLLIAAACIALTCLLAPQLARLLSPTVTGDNAARLVRYLRFFSITFVFTAFQSIYAAVLNANDRYVPGKLYGVVYNPIAIGCAVLLSGRFGIRVLLWAYLAGNLLQTLLLRQCSRRIFTFRPTLSLRNENVRYLVQLSIPLLLSNLFLQLNGVVDKALCSYLGEGFASNYQYAYTLEQFVTGTITATLSLILLSRYSTYVAEHDTERLTDEFHRSVSGLVLLLAPIALLACLFSADLVRIVYLRGEFDAAAAQYTAQALVGFAVGFPLVAIREMLIRLHFAYQNTKMPMLSNIASVVLNAALSILLARYIGILGIALATSLSAMLTIFLLDRSARQYLPKHRFSAFVPLFLRVAMACALAALPALALRRWLPAASLAGLLGRFLLSALCAGAVYLAALLAVRCPELKQALQGLRGRLSRR